MKRLIFPVLLVMSVAVSRAQESRLSISGGYIFGHLEEIEASATGWRIGAMYEMVPLGSKLSHGFAVSYLATKASGTILGNNVSYNISSLPLCYVPKFTFGNDALQGFVKGAIGFQFATIDREGSAQVQADKDSGFYVGLGAGIKKDLNDQLSLTLDYEWALMDNSFYRDGFMNSIQLGIAYSF